MRWFQITAGAILALTGFAKIVSASGSSGILNTLDPLFGIPFRQLILLVGLLELSIAVICAVAGLQRVFLYGLAWLSTIFFIYRFELWELGWQRPCVCLGNFTDALHISPQTADTAMKIILAYLLIGSYTALFWLWRQKCKPTLATNL
jgi:hypothetical protein